MTRNQTIPAILPTTFESMVAPWLMGIARRDIVAVVSYPASDRQRRVLQLLADNKIHRKYGATPNRYIWIGVDFRVDPIDDVADLEKHLRRKLADQTGMKISEHEPTNEVIKRFEYRSKQKIILYCFGCEQLLRNRAIPLLIWFTVQCRVDSLRMLLFFETNLFDPDTLSLFGSVPAFQPRIVELPLYGAADTKQFITHMMQSIWHFTIAPGMTNRIISQCGGMFLLVKEALWYLRDHPKATADAVFSHTEMQFNLAALWNGFDKKEQEVLEGVVKREELNDQSLLSSILYLEHLGFLTRERTGWKITIPLLTHYVQKLLTHDHQLTLNGQKQILLDSVPVDAHFSRAQHRILVHLLLHTGQIIPRDAIAELLWPHDTQTHYSDWAIDSALSRLRTRLIQLGLSAHMLETKKGKGFIFSP